MLDIKIMARRAPSLEGARRLPFERLANIILGNRYELSLVICGNTLAHAINKKYRPPAPRLRRAGKKTYSPNVLSFPLSKNEGEIFLNIRKAEQEAKKNNIPARNRIALLYVHGLYHLKGLRHGEKMERAERTTLKKFKLL